MIKNILIIEDDSAIRELLNDFLLENGFSVKTAETGAKGIKIAEKALPDLVILDLGLPDIDGESVCRAIKKLDERISVIILTARNTTEDQVRGLNLGADDYLTKPFESDILLARIRARLRDSGENNEVIQIDDLVMNTKTMEVKRGKKQIILTPQEYKLLYFLMTHKNQVLSRDMIINRIWLSTADIETRVVDVYIGYLRKKIDSNANKKLIHSTRGFGYSIKE